MTTVQICVFNPVTTYIDQVTAAVLGPGVPGQPIVLNAQGFIDQTLLGQGVIATVAMNLSPGNLVNLYSQGGTLHAQLAYAASGGTAPSGATYPIPANGFMSSQIFTGGTGNVSFGGTFVYIDGYSEFSASDIGTIVFLSAITPGGVTKTPPSGVGQLAQSVGYVVGFAAPNLVTVAYSPAFLDFTQINGILPVVKGGTGATTASAALVSLIGGTPANGDALVWNGTAWVPSPMIGGSIAATQVAFGSGAGTITGSPNFTYSSGNLLIDGVPTNTATFGNTTAATSGLAQPSPSIVLQGNSWYGGSSVDTWTIQNQPGIFPDTGQLIIAHSGSPASGVSIGGTVGISGLLSAPDAVFTFGPGAEGLVLTLTAATTAVGGQTTYTVNPPIPGGQFINEGMRAKVAGFANAGNNGYFVVYGGGGPNLTLYNPGGVAETHAATATFDGEYANSAGFQSAFGYIANYVIEGTAYGVPAGFMSSVGAPIVTLSANADAMDSAYMRILNNGATGDHGLEIGAIVDGTGADPAVLRLGHLDGGNNAAFNCRLLAWGTPLTAANVALGAGWGTISGSPPTPSVEISGYDSACTVTVTSGTASLAANPTFTLTFADGAYQNTPVVICQQVGGSDMVSFVTIAPSPTAPVFTWNSTPNPGQTYIFSILVKGVM